ncbi:MAG: diguanylate cyclase, partial [Actinomycetales bacterium]|nr:diguanylate cyclase [Actinomycetales bacterium]
ASPVAEVVTASCGIAVTSGRSLDRSEHLIDAADKALYQAKAEGRDRVVHADETEAPHIENPNTTDPRAADPRAEEEDPRREDPGQEAGIREAG